MSEEPPITYQIPENEKEAEAEHSLLISEDGEVEEADDGDS